MPGEGIADFEFTGTLAELRVGYQWAATIADWSAFANGDGSYEVVGTLRWAHSYWLTQRPIALALRVGAQGWTWLNVQPVVEESTVFVSVRGVPRAAMWGGSES